MTAILMLITFLVTIILLLALSSLAFWWGNPVIFMLTAGITMMAGLYSPDALSALGYSTFGISIGLMLIMYSFICIAFGYRSLFRGSK